MPVLVLAYLHIHPIPILAWYITGTGITLCRIGNMKEHYTKCHNIYASTSIVPPFLGALLELVICMNGYPVVQYSSGNGSKKCQYAY
jgi:hypothetical protein